MVVLGIETSCDETSASIVREGRILSNVVSSQVALHAPHGGVVPEVASRQHLRLVDAVIRSAYDAGGVESKEIQAVAVTRGPGLPSALLVGVAAARGLALQLKKPLIPIHHMEAHLYSPGSSPEGHIALIVSGGHTLLYHVRSFGDLSLLGQTVDDAVGEAFDKAARMLGLKYPGGPEIEREAKKGNPAAFDFPRPMLDSKDWEFSFSGLKTSLKREVEGKRLGEQEISDLCASFQKAISDVLVGKTIRAARTLGLRHVSLSGGVACNQSIQNALALECQKAGIQLAVAERRLCTDNAAMVALLAEMKLVRGYLPDGDWDIQPDWVLQ